MKYTAPQRLCLALTAWFIVGAPFTIAAHAQELPRVFLDTTYAPPSIPPGTLRAVTAGDAADFQAKLNEAQLGDIIELPAGATFTGNFILPAKTGSGWIYIQTTGYDSLPAPGNRVSPAQGSIMAKLVTPNSDPVLVTDAAAHHYRFVGIEITSTSDSTTNLVHLEARTGQTETSQIPTDIVFDRCYVHGNTAGTYRRGILMNSARTAVIDSYLEEFHEVGADSQALNAYNGPGPFKIVNNYLSGAGENLMFGGVDPAVTGLVASDVEIRGNYFFKPLTWDTFDPSYAGIPYIIKNIFEIKNGQRMLVEGNIFQNNWGGQGQAGYAIVFTPRSGGACESGGIPWCVVQDITFQKNVVRNTPGGVEILSVEDDPDFPYPTLETSRILLKDNLFDAIGIGQSGDANVGVLFKNAHSFDPSIGGGVKDSTVDHNTLLLSHGDDIYFGDDTAPENLNTNITIRNNILVKDPNAWGILGTGAGEGSNTLNTYTVNSSLAATLIVGATASDYPSANTCAPATTCYPTTTDEIGFVNWQEGDYRLCAAGMPRCATASPYKGAGTDGRDLGADIAAVNAAVANVISGASSSGCGTQAPYSGSAISIPGTFEAENFDLGCEGVAYHDVGAGNAGGQYRPSEDVDIIAGTGNASGYVVNNLQTGEWLEYTVNVATSRAYTIELNASSELTGSQFHVEIDGTSVSGSVPVPNTGWWGTFQWVSTGAVTLSAGEHVLRVSVDQEYFNLDAIRIVEAGTTLLSDSFTGSGAPSSSWVIGTFTGSTQDPSVSVARVSDALQIGPLANVATWNGLYSGSSYAFSNGQVQVRIAQVASGINDYTMFAAGYDVNNFYRAQVHNGNLDFQKKVGGAKTVLLSIPYDSTQHQFVKISNSGGNVVFSTAPSGGSWTIRYSEAWNTAAIPLSSVRFELKAGADAADSGSRSAQFDDFVATTP